MKRKMYSHAILVAQVSSNCWINGSNRTMCDIQHTETVLLIEIDLKCIWVPAFLKQFDLKSQIK